LPRRSCLHFSFSKTAAGPWFPKGPRCGRAQLVSRVLSRPVVPPAPLTGAREFPRELAGGLPAGAAISLQMPLPTSGAPAPESRAPSGLPASMRPGRASPRFPREIVGGKLFDLARGGACRASAVTSGAVRSYRTVSPLPVPWAGRRSKPTDGAHAVGHRSARSADLPGPSAVCSLWRYPSPVTAAPEAPWIGRVGATHHRALSRSDFPRRGRIPAAAALLRHARNCMADAGRMSWTESPDSHSRLPLPTSDS